MMSYAAFTVEVSLLPEVMARPALADPAHPGGGGGVVCANAAGAVSTVTRVTPEITNRSDGGIRICIGVAHATADPDYCGRAVGCARLQSCLKPGRSDVDSRP